MKMIIIYCISIWICSTLSLSQNFIESSLNSSSTTWWWCS